MLEEKEIDALVKHLSTDIEIGLTEVEADRRLKRDGRNEMQEVRRLTRAELFLKQLNDPLIYVLLVAAAVSILLKEVSDAVIIGVVVLLNAVVGLVQEGKAIRALDALKELASPKAMVIRDGKHREIPSAEVVVGDLVCLEAGNQVPADLRLIETVNLKIEESALTGESLPTEKDAGFFPKGEHLPLGDRIHLAYMSTIVTYGRGLGIVTATGMHTELGRIASMITQTKEEMTPLQKRLGELGKLLSFLSLLLCGALFVVAVIQQRNIPGMLITAISLAVAAVPEGLPAVVTICLALSVTRMVKVNTIVRRLPSVETLGAVSVVCSDKTGTLTQNRMTVEKCFLCGEILPASRCHPEQSVHFFKGMTLCNDGVKELEERVGDPTELALLDFAEEKGITRRRLEQEYPRVGEIPFDSDRKMMTTCHEGEKRYVYVKGAPDEVLKRCNRVYTGVGSQRLGERERREITSALEKMTGEGLRTLAVAMKTLPPGKQSARQNEEIQGTQLYWEEGLLFLGLVGMRDPVRPEAAVAVRDFKGAGVNTVMITGDHVDTAYAIGRELGIVEDFSQCMTGARLEHLSEEDLAEELKHIRVFARVSPGQKVKIVKGFQKRGDIVAMTGDGVNDAPSLKMADVGIAMGKAGTDVARQASDMILTDDNFATIRRAIEEGRGVYENIRKSVIFLLSSNMGEIITMFVAVIAGLSSPLKSSHILWINLITDSLPALALGMDKNNGKSLMEQTPRKPEESLFSRGGFTCTILYGCLIAGLSLAAFLMLPVALLPAGQAVDVAHFGEILSLLRGILNNPTVLQKSQTYAFTVLGMSQLFHAVGMRDMDTSIFRMKHTNNLLMIVAVVVGFALQFAVTEVPFLVNAFGTSPLSMEEWGLLTALSAMPLLLHEIIVFTGRKKK